MADEIRARFFARGSGGPFPDGSTQSFGLDDVAALATVSLRPGAGEVFRQFQASKTLAAGGSWDLDLNNPANPFLVGGTPLQLASVRWFLLAVADPAPGKVVRVGPQGVTNGCPLWFGGTGGTYWTDEPDTLLRVLRPGVSVTPSTASVVRFKNPSADTPVTFGLWIAGAKAS